MNWYVGQKVVFVGHKPNPGTKYASTPFGRPQLNQVYVICGFMQYPEWGPDTLGLQLVGLPTSGTDGEDTGWDSRSFRPLQELKDEARTKRTASVPSQPSPNAGT